MRYLLDQFAARLDSAAVPIVWLVGALAGLLLIIEVLLGHVTANSLLIFLPLGIGLGLYLVRRQTEAQAREEALNRRLFAEADARSEVPSLAVALTFEGIEYDRCNRALDVIERRLRTKTRAGDRVQRHGSAGFVLLPHGVGSDVERAVQMATRLQRLCEAKISLDGQSLRLTPTIGFARNEDGEIDTELLIARALAAAEAAFLNGPGEIRGWTPAIQDDIALRLSMKSVLTRAFERGEIRPWFQPQVSTDTGEITGVEALARWEHPDRGLVPPPEFLPFVTTSGLSSRLTRVMIDGALTALAAWDEAGLHVPRVSVNLAPQDLSDTSLAKMIARRLERHGIAPQRLGLEVLESVVTTDKDSPVKRNLKKLDALGCYIDLDDFGTGNTSITTIRRLPIKRIKIDRSFVINVDTDPEQEAFVRAQLTLAEQLSLDTLGEGVETPGEHAMLAQLGCAHVQGFGIGRPMPADSLLSWADTHRASLPRTQFGAPKRPDKDTPMAVIKAKSGDTQVPGPGKTS